MRTIRRSLCLCTMIAMFCLLSPSESRSASPLQCYGGAYQTTGLAGSKYFRGEIRVESCAGCGTITAEVDWDEGAGFGENQQKESTGGQVRFSWGPHEYASNGNYHPKFSADDALGNSCEVVDFITVNGW